MRLHDRSEYFRRFRRLRAMLPEPTEEAYVRFNNMPWVIDAERFRTLLNR